ncbi:MAG: TetR/AcrR family transcriptional regulator [Gemmatimonadetes bacterium]|nr:TetR/AcrR family transcriptional regulator [Gemmatimonadota bacterium]
MAAPKTRPKKSASGSVAPRNAAPSKAAARKRDGETERRILDAARTVFIRRGSGGARMQEIAEEAGVNQALLHYYFGTKEGLALAVFRESAARLFPGILRILASDAPIEARVEQVVHHYIDTLRAHPFLPGFVLGEMNFNPERMVALASEMASLGVPDAPRRALDALGRDLAKRAARGDFRKVTADQFMVNLASLCVFPFAARPMLTHLLGIDQAGWERFLDVRRAELPQQILNTLRP